MPLAETIVRNAHYPGRATIDGYGQNGFRFADMSHRGDLLCLPSGIYGWHAPAASAIDERDLTKVFVEANEIEFLLIGTGCDLVPLSKSFVRHCREAGISCETMATGAAVRTYNVLLAEARAVAAALIAVD